MLKSGCSRNRTYNLRIKSPMLCQLSYAPMNTSGGTRTHTSKTQEPKSCASTNFATLAGQRKKWVQ